MMKNCSKICGDFRTWNQWRIPAVLLCLAWTLFAVGSKAVGQDQEEKAKEPAQKVEKVPEDSKPTAKTHPYDPMIWDVDQMMEDAITQISRRYNLNESQEEYTRLLLKTRVRAFLDDHEHDIRELLQESIEYRRGLRNSDPESLKIWAERAGPIYEAAQDAILNGNMAWRDILNDKQKERHDADVKLMKRNFNNVSERLVAWQQGKGKLPLNPNQAQQNVRHATDDRISNNPRQLKAELEDNWTLYVNKFIETYKLNEKQQNSAREKIHKEYLAEAKKYRTKLKDKFADIEEKLADKDRKAERARLLNRKTQLERPIYEMFRKMAYRLSDLLTSEQKATVDPDKKQKLDELYDRFSGKKASKSKAPAIEPKPKPKSDEPKKQPAAGETPNKSKIESKKNDPAEKPTKQSGESAKKLKQDQSAKEKAGK